MVWHSSQRSIGHGCLCESSKVRHEYEQKKGEAEWAHWMAPPVVILDPDDVSKDALPLEVDAESELFLGTGDFAPKASPRIIANLGVLFLPPKIERLSAPTVVE